MRTPLLALAVLLTGCGIGKTGTGADYFDDFACSAEPWDWYGDPVTYLLEADEDGDFELDPPAAYITGIDGSYDYEDGDLEWSTSYVSDFTTVSAETSGYGTVFDDGDLDLLLKTVAEDVLGVVVASRVRYERSGCSATMKTWEIEPDEDLDSTPGEDPFTWTYEIESDDLVSAEATDSGWSYRRVWKSDQTITTSGSSAETTYEAVSQGDGTRTAWQESSDGDYDSRVEQSTTVSGLTSVYSQVWYSGTSTLAQECEYDVTYAGVGSGTCSFDNNGGTIECDLSFDQSSCVLECGSAGSFDC